jgi:hypothetical protein
MEAKNAGVAGRQALNWLWTQVALCTVEVHCNSIWL